MLAKSTIAGQEGVITYLANAAALQQFEQTALAYVLMSEAGRSMGAPGLAAAAESLLEGKFEVLIAVCLPSLISAMSHDVCLQFVCSLHHTIVASDVVASQHFTSCTQHTHCHGSDCMLQTLNLLACLHMRCTQTAMPTWSER